MMRWRPNFDMLRLRDEFDRLFEESLDFPKWRPMEPFGDPAVDVAETDDAYIVKASVPGIKPDNLDISVIGNTLTIKGEVEDEETISEEQYHIRERRYGSFARTINLPVPVDADSVAATYEDGVLTLTAPKTEGDRRKRITINQVKSTKMLKSEAE
ncbi:MAG: Hsp20/alpha crystallin family protein [Chloroflexota bacterium]